MIASQDSIKIPGYSLVRVLGRGGMATVYLAVQQSFEREVALKVMSSALAERPQFSERFLHEARIVARLFHPNIVTVYDVGVYEGHHYLSMEYIPGPDLKSSLKELDASAIIRVMKEVGSALEYAGRKGYVHRDVKPENILLHAEDGRAVLTDFGIAKAADNVSEMTQTGMTLGTPHYMSPEQARGQTLDHRSDLYSLGILFYLMMIGRVPYEAESAVAIGLKHVSDPLPQLPPALTWFQPILDRLLAKKPEHRFQSGAELVTELERIPLEVFARLDQFIARGRQEPDTSSEPTPLRLSAVSEDAASHIRYPKRDRRGLRAALLVLLLVGVMGGVWQAGLLPKPLAQILDERWAWLRLAAAEFHQTYFGSGGAVAESAAPVQVQSDRLPEVSAAAETEEVASDSLPSSDQAQQLAEPLEDPEQRLRDELNAIDELFSQLSMLEQPETAAEVINRYRALQLEWPESREIDDGLGRFREAGMAALQQLISLKQFDDAREWRALMLGWFPALADDDSGFSALSETLERSERVAEILIAAEEQLAGNKLSTPEGDNALSSFLQVLELEPSNETALLGIQAISDRYQRLALRAVEQHDLKQAELWLARGREAQPDSGGLLAVQARIEELAQKLSLVRDFLAEAERSMDQKIWFGRGGAAEKLRAAENLLAGDARIANAWGSLWSGFKAAVTQQVGEMALDPAQTMLEPAYVEYPNHPVVLELVAKVDGIRPAVSELRVSASSDGGSSLNGAAIAASRTLHVDFRYRNFSTDSTLLQALLYDGARQVKIATVAVIVDGRAGNKRFRIDRPIEGFDAGGYHIDLSLDGKPIGTHSFVVESLLVE